MILFRYAHLINIEFFDDLFKVISQLVESEVCRLYIFKSIFCVSELLLCCVGVGGAGVAPLRADRIHDAHRSGWGAQHRPAQVLPTPLQSPAAARRRYVPLCVHRLYLVVVEVFDDMQFFFREITWWRQIDDRMFGRHAGQAQTAGAPNTLLLECERVGGSDCVFPSGSTAASARLHQTPGDRFPAVVARHRHRAAGCPAQLRSG